MKFNLSTITIQQIQIFFAVVESNGFANAGIDLHLTQSAISKSISKMENDLDIPLFIRSTRELHLTEAGEILYKEWKTQINNMNIAYHHAYAIQEHNSSTLRIGLLNTVHPDNYFYPILDQFNKLYPGVNVITDSGYITDLEQDFDNWMYDAIIVPDVERNYIENRKWKWKYAARDNACVLMSAHHPLADKEELDIQDILGYDQVTVKIGQRKDNFLFDLRERFEPYGVVPNVTYSYDNIYNLRYMLLQPNNAVLFIDNFFDYSSASEKIKKIPVRNQYKGIICVWNPVNRNPHLKHFLDLLPFCDTCKDK